MGKISGDGADGLMLPFYPSDFVFIVFPIVHLVHVACVSLSVSLIFTILPVSVLPPALFLCLCLLCFVCFPSL